MGTSAPAGREAADRAKLAAMRLLARRPRSVRELSDRLGQRFSDGAVRATVESLRETRLVDDEAFARWWTDSRTGSRPMAAAMIRAELARKGVDADVIARAVGLVDDEANARALAERLCGSIPADDFEVFARRLAGRIARRGYPADLVRSVVREAWERRGAAPARSPLPRGL